MNLSARMYVPSTTKRSVSPNLEKTPTPRKASSHKKSYVYDHSLKSLFFIDFVIE